VKNILKIQLLFLALISACVPQAANVERAGLNQGQVITSGGSGNGSLPNDGGLGNTTTEDTPPIVEIRNLVEPNIIEDENYTSGIGVSGPGTYVRKMTLPKNYQGRLYIGGININSLSDRIVRVRFNFGYGRDPITVQATVAKAPGMTPQTNIDVLVLDLRDRPFEDVRMLYDLYDYKDYGVFDSSTTYIDTNRDGNLYCRGLRLEDDNTFNGQGACDGVDSFGAPLTEQCLYTYAKVLDKGLTKKNGANFINTYPSLTQTELRGNGYYRDNADDLVKRCLPDVNPIAGHILRTDDTATVANELIQFILGTASPVTVPLAAGNQEYVYEGPFKSVNLTQWGISGNALVGSKGLFAYALPLGNLEYAYGSMMYPRFGKMDLNSGVENLSSATPLGVRTIDPFPTAGETQWMDGCNMRAQSLNPQGEHVGSCNVSASIQVIAKDDNGVDFVVAETNDVVLQLTRPSVMSTQNGDTLYSNFRSCTNSSQCGASECCFNQRCWSNALVSQCVESAPVVGNKPVGQACLSDFECSSLCCNRGSGLCSIHNNLLTPPVLCSKPLGDFCIAKEWCQKQTVTNCYIVKTGTTPLGGVTCARRCYSQQVHGDCRQGICVSPPAGYVDNRDPSDPEVCNEDTMDPPEF
jgi:hypothetical protein